MPKAKRSKPKAAARNAPAVAPPPPEFAHFQLVAKHPCTSGRYMRVLAAEDPRKSFTRLCLYVSQNKQMVVSSSGGAELIEFDIPERTVMICTGPTGTGPQDYESIRALRIVGIHEQKDLQKEWQRLQQKQQPVK